MATPDEKKIVNLVYQSAVLSGTVIGYSMIAKKLLKIKMGSMDKLDLEEFLKIAGIVSVSNWTVEMLYDKNIIPRVIMK